MEYLPALGLIFVAIFAIPLSIIDFKEHRLPNQFTYPAIVVSAACLALAGVWTMDLDRFLVAAAIGGITFGLGYLLAGANGIGMGDIKLLTAINLAIAWFSPFAVLVILAIGFTTAALVSVALMIAGRANLKSTIALGPFLLFAFILVSLDLGIAMFTAAGGS